MYIPEFWCGVIATIMAEIGVFIASLSYAGRKNMKNKNERGHDDEETNYTN